MIYIKSNGDILNVNTNLRLSIIIRCRTVP